MTYTTTASWGYHRHFRPSGRLFPINSNSITANRIKTLLSQYHIKTVQKKKEDEMFKKNLFALIFGAILYMSLFSVVYGSEPSPAPITVDQNAAVVVVDYDVTKKTKFEVMLGDKSYMYELKDTDTPESFPLQLGDGKYEFSIFEHIQGFSYKRVCYSVQMVDVQGDNTPYLASVQNVKWVSSDPVAMKAMALTANLKTDSEKVSAIAGYVMSNVKYDYDKIKTLVPGYEPDPVSTLKTGKGICYDYASLTAAMLRSIGIPTKLVKGFTTLSPEYHAWNEVLVNGEWKTVDTTFGSQMKGWGMKVSTFADADAYKKKLEY